MNLPSESQRAADAELGLREVGRGSGTVTARLQYRSLAAEDLESASAASGDRRRQERRTSLKAASASAADGAALSKEDMQQALQAAHDEGFQRGEREGKARARAEMETGVHAATASERMRMAQVLEAFGESRQRYFAEIEGQVVRLALAIAARVLHRETQMDALVLSGAVRVALDKLAERSGAVLRVPEADTAAWDKVFDSMDADQAPKVIGDPGLGRGDCVLETAMGMVELGVSTQMEEIEKGFFDLLSLNPEAVEVRA